MLRRHAIPILIGIATAVAVFAQTHSYGLFGFDSYPILLTSRVQNLHDLLGIFTEELMDGRFEGRFYRPILNLSFALDAAIWKLNPLGFQLTNAILFGAAIAVTWILARRLLGFDDGGEYLPTSHAVIWTREAMLKWAGLAEG